jgi:hypothetical protein
VVQVPSLQAAARWGEPATPVMYGRPLLGKEFLGRRLLIWSGHVFGLLMRSD